MSPEQWQLHDRLKQRFALILYTAKFPSSSRLSWNERKVKARDYFHNDAEANVLLQTLVKSALEEVYTGGSQDTFEALAIVDDPSYREEDRLRAARLIAHQIKVNDRTT